MGSILEKLQYIAETKAMFREAIDKKIPGYITDASPFSSYRYAVQSIPALTEHTVSFINKYHAQAGRTARLCVAVDGVPKEITQTQTITVAHNSLLVLYHNYAYTPQLTGIAIDYVYDSADSDYFLKGLQVTQDCTISV